MTTRHYIVSRHEAGRPVAEFLRARLALSRPAVHRLLRGRQVRLDGTPCPDPMRRLRRGQRVEVGPDPSPRPPPRSGEGGKGRRTPPPGPLPEAGRGSRPSPPPRFGEGVGGRGEATPVIRHADAAVVVVDKPPGLTTMRHAEEAAEFGRRARRYLPPTLADLLPGLLAKGRPGPPPSVRAVHRIDNETSGLVVFARTLEAERCLGRQFRAHSTERLYLAVVRGRARAARIESWLVRDRGDGRRGSTAQAGEGQRAVTHVRVVEELGDYTLVECRLETGRTHQVRIHLGEAGTPLCGERIYDRPLNGKPLPDGSGAARVALHAATLGFDHPATGRRVRWTAPLPQDLADLVKRLRKQARAARDAAGPGA